MSLADAGNAYTNESELGLKSENTTLRADVKRLMDAAEASDRLYDDLKEELEQVKRDRDAYWRERCAFSEDKMRLRNMLDSIRQLAGIL